MALIIHIAIAVVSMAFVTYLYAFPSRHKFYVAYGTLAATIGSGTYLILATHGNLLRSCLAGLAYIGIMLTAMASARHKLANQQLRREE